MTARRPLVLFFTTKEFLTWGEPVPEGLLRDCATECEITTSMARLSEADAVVFHVPTLTGLRQVPKRPGQLWIAWSMESELNFPQLQNPRFLGHFDLTMTYRLNSDVPILYVTECFGADPSRALRAAPAEKTAEAPAVYFDSNTWARTRRAEYVSELMQYVGVHSYGRSLRNRELAEDKGRPTKLATIARYKFTIAIENSYCQDYVTEKFYDPLVAGSVPVYRGAPNIEDFVPGDRCYIRIEDFTGPRELAEYLTMLDRDDKEYGRYFEWKQAPLRPGFEQVVAAYGSDPKCRLAAKLVSLHQASASKGRLAGWWVRAPGSSR
jgi:hypothetical protein